MTPLSLAAGAKHLRLAPETSYNAQDASAELRCIIIRCSLASSATVAYRLAPDAVIAYLTKPEKPEIPNIYYSWCVSIPQVVIQYLD